MPETEQMKFWKGNFGNEYISRNIGNFDKLYKKQYGISRSALNAEFLQMLSKDAFILEVGCNVGNQLKTLQKAGFSSLFGLEINKKALQTARKNKELSLVEGSAFDIPFKDIFFDLVFTSGVLIHISPDDLPKAVDEIYRVAKKYIWCFEYFSEKCEEVVYRGHNNRLWKNNFLNIFLERHPDLKIIRQKKIKYLENENVDMMFLLEKSTDQK